jgi:hypothetical protein
MSETQEYVLGANILPGMVVGGESPFDQFATEQRLVLSTKRLTQRRLFGKWVDVYDLLELLVVSNSATDPFIMRADAATRYSLHNVVQFMLNYTGPTIPDKVWVERASKE